VKDDPNVSFTKGKVAMITEDPETKDVIVEAEDIMAGKKIKVKFDMVVLAAGMVPSTKAARIPGDISYTPGRFCCGSLAEKGHLRSWNAQESC